MDRKIYCVFCELKVNLIKTKDGLLCQECKEIIVENSEEICNICDEIIESNIYEDGQLSINDWLIVDEKCVSCNRKGCYYCMTTCYTCSNIGKVSITSCKDCLDKNNLISVECNYHNWYVCPDHKDDDCGHCDANKNYCGRHQIF